MSEKEPEKISFFESLLGRELMGEFRNLVHDYMKQTIAEARGATIKLPAVTGIELWEAVSRLRGSLNVVNQAPGGIEWEIVASHLKSQVPPLTEKMQRYDGKDRVTIRHLASVLLKAYSYVMRPLHIPMGQRKNKDYDVTEVRGREVASQVWPVLDQIALTLEPILRGEGVVIK